MTIDFSEIKPSRGPLPPHIVLFGTPEDRQVELRPKIPDNIFLDVEGGTGHLTVARGSNVICYRLGKMSALYLTACSSKNIGIRRRHHQHSRLPEKVLQIQAAMEHDAKKLLPRSGMAKAMYQSPICGVRFIQKLDALRERRGMAIIIICR